MSGLAGGWLSHSELVALGWTLLHFLWQGTAVVAAYALADRLIRGASTSARYALAIGALGLMPLMVLATFASEMGSVARPLPTTASTRLASGVPSEYVDTLSLPSNSRSIAALTRREISRLTQRAEPILPWLDTFWMLGVVLLATRAMGGWRQLEQLRRSARRIVPIHVEQSFLRVCERVQVGRQVALRVSDHVISPMAMGVWRATVILPMSAVLNLSTEELEAVLAHELGHIRRWDYACNLLQTALETVLFFHPAVWWLSRKVRDRREVCCDEIAVRSCSDPIVYAQTLLRLEEQKLARHQWAVALNGSNGSLLGRVKKVLGEDEPMDRRVTSGVRVVVASAVVVGLLLVPKMSDAVAASRPTGDHTVTLIPQAVSSVTTPKPTPAHRSEDANASEATTSALSAGTSEGTASNSTSTEDGQDSASTGESQSESKPHSKGISYIDGMRDAGYPLDLNNDLNILISLKSLGVTPEYAKSMAALGLGKPSVHELISLKALGVTPEYVAELKQSGLGPKDFHEVTTEKALGITPEYAAEMKKTGFGDMSIQELVSLKAQNVTPEYIGWLRQQFPQITLDQVRQAAVFHLDDKFLAQAKSHGFDGKDLGKLLRLKISGLLDE